MNQAHLEGYSLSPQQKRLWRLDQHNQICCLTLQVDRAITAERLRTALEAVIADFEIFRTRFETIAGMTMPLQVIEEQAQLGWREITSEMAAPIWEPAAGINLYADFQNRAEGSNTLTLYWPLACGDGYSAGPVLHALSEALGFETSNADDEETEEALQYADFSEWQSGMLEDEDATFWQHQPLRQLSGFELFGLTAETEPCQTAHLAWQVDETLQQQVAALSDTLNKSQLDIWRAAWFAVLYLQSGQPEIVVEHCFSGRDLEPLNITPGLIARYLPLAQSFSPQTRFRDLLEELTTQHDTFDEQQMFFDRETHMGEAGGFQNGVAFRVEPQTLQEAAEWIRDASLSWQSESFPLELCLSVTEEADRVLAAKLYHQTNSVPVQLATYLKEGLAHLIGALSKDLEAPLSAAMVLGETQSTAVHQASHGAKLEVQNQNIVAAFTQQVDATPERDALVWDNTRLSFKALDEQSSQVAHLLLQHQVGPGEQVPLVLDRSSEMIIGLLAILKTGAIMVPMDPHQPKARLTQIFEEIQPRLILSRSAVKELDVADAQRINIDEVTEGNSSRPPHNFPSDLPAYAIYTSGTTGKPKGALLSHRSVINLAYALQASVYSDSQEHLRIAMNAPLVFDASVKQWIQLIFGRTLFIVPDDARPDGKLLLQFIQQHQLDGIDLTPSQMQVVLSAMANKPKASLPRFTLLGGEDVSVELWRDLNEAFPGQVFNVYGPTETCVDATCARFSDAESPNLGSTIANVETYVLLQNGDLAPIGVPGELFIGGAGLAHGYLKRPELTAQKFVPHPFSNIEGARLYRTGDLVRRNWQGQLVFEGRIDHQVKLRGFRIELGEIESALKQHVGVDDCAVRLRNFQEDDQRLVGYVVPRKEARHEWDGAVRRRLPNGMSLFQQNPNETEYLYEEIFAKKAYACYGITLPEGAVILDVGANIGMFSLWVLQHCPNATIYAFEPLPPIYDTLSRNLEFYGNGNITTLPFGCSQREQETSFLYYPRYSMMSGDAALARPEDEVEVVKSFLEHQASQGSEEAVELLQNADALLEGRFTGEQHHVRLRPLNEVFREQNIEHVDVLKIDVQRAELDVLLGLADEDWQKIDQVVLEAHADAADGSAHRVEQITDLLKQHGFAVATEQDELLIGTDRYNLYARRAGVAEREASFASFMADPEFVTRATPLEEQALRDLAHQYLPDYMVPSAFVMLDRFPLTRNGKLDERALPEPQWQESDDITEDHEEQPPLLEIMKGLWRDLLGSGVHDSDAHFFELGGHSLLATQLMARIRELFDIDMPLRTLFEHPKLSDLLKAVEQQINADAQVNEPPLQATALPERIPLSFAQNRIWFVSSLDPDNPQFNSLAAFEIRGPLQKEALEKTLHVLVERHAILRTTYEEYRGTPYQVIGDAVRFGFHFEDLQELAQDQRDMRVRTLIDNEAATPFDLQNGPILRVVVVQIDTNKHYVLFNMHHIAGDAWSNAIMIRDIAEIYEAHVQKKAPDLAPLALQYSHFSHWQRGWLRGEVMDKYLAYWKRTLSGELPTLQLPLDRPRQEHQDHDGVRLTFDLPAELTEQVKHYSRSQGVTLYMTLLSGFLTTLHRYSQQEDILLGMAIAGRERAETQNLVGCLINMLVLRSDLSGAPSFDELVARTRKRTLEAYQYQACPFDRLVQEINPERPQGVTPFFQVAFGLQNAPLEDIRLGDLEIELLQVEKEVCRYDLTIWMNEENGALSGDWTFRKALFDQATIELMGRRFQRVLEAAMTDPSQRIDTIKWETEAEAALQEQAKTAKQSSANDRLKKRRRRPVK